MIDIVYLTVEDVLDIHSEAMKLGGFEGAPDVAGIEASIGAVEQTFDGERLYSGYAEIATAYAFYIATRHSFKDGNKRTGVMAALTFLLINGVYIHSRDEWEIYETLMNVVRREASRADLAALFDRLVKAALADLERDEGDGE